MYAIRQTETFRRWEQKLRDRMAKAVIADRILRLSIGLFGDAASVGGGVQELRVHYGPGYRVYFQRRGSNVVLLLCGGDKGTQDRDIEVARRLATEWSDNDA
jgi:putative addiction module killer protein